MSWQIANLSFPDSNDVFRTAMELDHVDPVICNTYYRAVVDFGRSSYDNARTRPSILNPSNQPLIVPPPSLRPGWEGNRVLAAASYDGRHSILLAHKIWKHTDGRIFLLPQDATTDGASVPDALASFGLTFWGPWWMAAVLHDCCYRNNLWVWINSDASVLQSSGPSSSGANPPAPIYQIRQSLALPAV